MNKQIRLHPYHQLQAKNCSNRGFFSKCGIGQTYWIKSDTGSESLQIIHLETFQFSVSQNTDEHVVLGDLKISFWEEMLHLIRNTWGQKLQ